jgi:uncharacterized membrane protein (DUF4010 family)
MVLVGVLAGRGRLAEAVVVGGGTALVLHFKDRLHGFAGGLDARTSARSCSSRWSHW